MSLSVAFHPFSRSCFRACFASLLLLAASALAAAEAQFLRGINLNGPALTIDGRAWEAGTGAPNLTSTGKLFSNQKVALKPPTDAARAEMIRSSIWGGGKIDVVVSNLPAGAYQVFLYVWEDTRTNNSICSSTARS